MLNDLKTKANLKKLIIGLNIGLAIVLSVLLVYWLVVVRPNQILTATANNQYGYYNLDKLPNNTGEITADYFGKTNSDTAKDQTEQSDDVDDFSKLTPEELLAKTNELLNTGQDSSSQKIKTLDSDPNLDDNNLQAQTENAPKLQKQAKIALLITNLGLNRKATELALNLPTECALGFLPYTKTLKPLMHKAQSNGHEVYLYLPMQTSKNSENQGKHMLTSDLAPEELAARLNVILNSHSKYHGVYTNYKEVFSDDHKAFLLLLDQVAQQNLLFVSGKAKNDKTTKALTENKNIVFSNLVIDEEADKKSIALQLENLTKLAQQNGVAVGYSQGFTLTIEMLSEWIQSLQKKGIKLIPISKLFEDQRS